MLSPEVWTFECPTNTMCVSEAVTSAEQLQLCDVIKDHYLNHDVSVVLPGCPNIPEDLSKLLIDDCDYYRVKLPLFRFIEKEFIDAFIRPGGEVTALSVGTRLDVDDCAAVTPTGHLVLSACRETYLRLGVEGTPWLDSSSAKPDRYGVFVDLKKECFKPGRPNYDRLLKSFKTYVPLAFDFIIAWEPHDDMICPSTIAKYLAGKGHDVRLCTPNFGYTVEKGLAVPSLETAPAGELSEWLGAFSLGVFKKDAASAALSTTTEEYLSTYRAPGGCTHADRVVMFRWRGLFTTRKLLRFLDYLRSYCSATSEVRWASLNVHGFADAPVSWRLQHHSYFTGGDNHYTVFVREGRMLCHRVAPSGRKIK